MATRQNNSSATRNPVQGPLTNLPAARKGFSGGYRRPVSSIVGPRIEQPLVNSQSQSARSNTAAYGSIPIGRDSTNSRVIDRASIGQSNAEHYGAWGSDG